MVRKGEGGKRLVEFLQAYSRCLLIGHQGHLACTGLSAASKLLGKRRLRDALARGGGGGAGEALSLK